MEALASICHVVLELPVRRALTERLLRDAVTAAATAVVAQTKTDLVEHVENIRELAAVALQMDKKPSIHEVKKQLTHAGQRDLVKEVHEVNTGRRAYAHTSRSLPQRVASALAPNSKIDPDIEEVLPDSTLQYGSSVLNKRSWIPKPIPKTVVADAPLVACMAEAELPLEENVPEVALLCEMAGDGDDLKEGSAACKSMVAGSHRMLTIQECMDLGPDALAKLPLDRIPAVVSMRLMREVMGLPPED